MIQQKPRGVKEINKNKISLKKISAGNKRLSLGPLQSELAKSMIPIIKLAPSKMLYTWARGKLKKIFFPGLSEKAAHENLSFSMWLWRGKLIMAKIIMGFPGNSVAKNLSAKAGEEGSIPGLGRSPRERNGNSLQYSCLGNPMDRGAWWATVYGVTKDSDTT